MISQPNIVLFLKKNYESRKCDFFTSGEWVIIQSNDPGDMAKREQGRFH